MQYTPFSHVHPSCYAPMSHASRALACHLESTRPHTLQAVHPSGTNRGGIQAFTGAPAALRGSIAPVHVLRGVRL